MTFRAGDLLEITKATNAASKLKAWKKDQFANACCVILEPGEHLIVLPTKQAFLANDWLRALSSAGIVFLWVSYMKHRVKGEKL